VTVPATARKEATRSGVGRCAAECSKKKPGFAGGRSLAIGDWVQNVRSGERLGRSAANEGFGLAGRKGWMANEDRQKKGSLKVLPAGRWSLSKKCQKVHPASACNTAGKSEPAPRTQQVTPQRRSPAPPPQTLPTK